MAKLVSFEIEIPFPSKPMGEQAGENAMSHSMHLSNNSVVYRMSLCSARPREIMGVISVTSDILVSAHAQAVSSSAHTLAVICLLTHFLIHEPKGNCLVSDQRLIMALSIGNTLLSPAAVLESPADIRHIPVFVFELF